MTAQLPPKPKIDLRQYVNNDGSIKSRKRNSPPPPPPPPQQQQQQQQTERQGRKPMNIPKKPPPLPQRPSSESLASVISEDSFLGSSSTHDSSIAYNRPRTSPELAMETDLTDAPPLLPRRNKSIVNVSPTKLSNSAVSVGLHSSSSSITSSPTRKSSASSITSSNSSSPVRNYTPKPAHTSVPLQTHLADHKPPPQIPTSFLSSKTKRILAANDRYVCVDTSHKTLLYSWRSSSLIWELKVVGLCASFVSETGTIWLGTTTGKILVVDVVHGRTTQILDRGHMKPVTYIASSTYGVVSLSSDDGKLNIWAPRNSGSPFKIGRIRGSVCGRSSFATTGGPNSHYLWVCKDRQIEIYQPASQMIPLVSVILPGRGMNLGSITSIAASGEMVFMGQNDGFITIFKGTQQLGSINGGIHSITALSATSSTELWVGTRSGEILIFALRLSILSDEQTVQLSATLLRQWKAHSAAINHIMLAESKSAILSTDRNHTVMAWNSTPVDVLPSFPSNSESFKVQVFTWNVGACAPDSIPQNWIVGPETINSDIIVIGLQEVVELENTSQHALNIVRPADLESDKDHTKWQQFLEAVLIPYGFTQVTTKSMVGIMSCLFVKRNLANFLTEVKTDVVKTGIGGTYGNKGGVVIAVNMAGMSWCFANCHLAAGHTAIIQRNRDASQIMSTDRLQTDVCFFFGDTNYRINAAREQAEQLIKDKNWDQLRKQDQLLSQIVKNPSFCLSRFQEGSLDFPPTYKYDKGTNFYDSSDKKRIPSWCDRILFRGKSIQVIEYKAVEKTSASDHKAVVGTYLVPRLV